jgi:hypothetical protein
MSEMLAKTTFFRMWMSISEHPKNKCQPQTHTFMCGWHIVFLIL